MIDFFVQLLDVILIIKTIQESISLVNSLHGFFDVALKTMGCVDRTDVIKILLKLLSSVLLTNNMIILSENFREIISVHQG